MKYSERFGKARAQHSFLQQALSFLAQATQVADTLPKAERLEEIGRPIDMGRLRAFVDRVLPIEQARQAFEQGLKGHSRGKIVLRIEG
jgi:NADPH:quinone reductase-like Zn-dependent oxidoreductase